MRNVCRNCGKEIVQVTLYGPKPFHTDSSLAYCNPLLSSFDTKVAEFKTKEDLVKDFLKQNVCR